MFCVLIREELESEHIGVSSWLEDWRSMFEGSGGEWIDGLVLSWIGEGPGDEASDEIGESGLLFWLTIP